MGERRVAPEQLVLRCMVEPDRGAPGRWVAVCIDLDLAAAGGSPGEAQASLHEAIRGYLLTVVETDDVESVAQLLRRRAPWRDRCQWHLLRLLSRLHRPGQGPPAAGHPYEDVLPFQLAAA